MYFKYILVYLFFNRVGKHFYVPAFCLVQNSIEN